MSIDSIFGAIDDLGAARAQLFCQCVNPCYPEVDVRRAIRRRMRTNDGLIGTGEKYLHLVAPHDGKDRRRSVAKANLFSIPIAGYLESENVTVVLGGSYQIRYSELWAPLQLSEQLWCLAH